MPDFFYTHVLLLLSEGFMFYVPPTAKVIRRQDLSLNSHMKDWRRRGSHSGPLVNKVVSLTARLRMRYWLSIFSNSVQNRYFTQERNECQIQFCVQIVQFLIIKGATLLKNAEIPDKIGKVFINKHGEKLTNCQKVHFLLTS